MKRDGIDVRADLSVHLLRRQFGRVDMRNHRKIAVIDGDIAYAGSQNIVNADYGKKDLIWRDMTMRVTGPIVLELQEVFAIDWYFAANELLRSDDVFHKPQQTGDKLVQALAQRAELSDRELPNHCRRSAARRAQSRGHYHAVPHSG